MPKLFLIFFTFFLISFQSSKSFFKRDAEPYKLTLLVAADGHCYCYLDELKADLTNFMPVDDFNSFKWYSNNAQEYSKGKGVQYIMKLETKKNLTGEAKTMVEYCLKQRNHSVESFTVCEKAAFEAAEDVKHNRTPRKIGSDCGMKGFTPPKKIKTDK